MSEKEFTKLCELDDIAAGRIFWLQYIFFYLPFSSPSSLISLLINSSSVHFFIFIDNSVSHMS